MSRETVVSGAAVDDGGEGGWLSLFVTSITGDICYTMPDQRTVNGDDYIMEESKVQYSGIDVSVASMLSCLAQHENRAGNCQRVSAVKFKNN